jgi:hypothetical protein
MRTLFFNLCLFASGLVGVATHAVLPTGTGPTKTASWEMLEFERKSMWGTANSRIQWQVKEGADIATLWNNPGKGDYLYPPGEHVLELTVDARAGKNQANLQLFLDPDTLAIFQGDRLTIGRKDRRNKFYRYRDLGVTRVRRDPEPGESALPAEQWSKVTQTEVDFSQLPAGSIVTSPYAVLLAASVTSLAPGEATTVWVHTDFNLYQVELKRGPDTRLKSSYVVLGPDGTATSYAETRMVESIGLLATPTAQAPDKPDFEILGLGGEITILLDRERGLPLRVLGTAPRVGEAYLDLKSARLVEEPAP